MVHSDIPLDDKLPERMFATALKEVQGKVTGPIAKITAPVAGFGLHHEHHSGGSAPGLRPTESEARVALSFDA